MYIGVRVKHVASIVEGLIVFITATVAVLTFFTGRGRRMAKAALKKS